MADRTDKKRFSSGDPKTSNLDDPPNSRLFIIGSKQLTEQDYEDAFSKFGKIDEVWVVRDRQSGERKGVTYIKYSKTSEAAAALEEMNGKMVGNTGRPIKVMIAASREQGAKRDGNEEEKIQRLFVIVPKSMTDTELYDTFKVYGDIDYASIIKDKETKENKGFAYIKYYKFSHAAAAFEQCDRKFKAVFAEPRKAKTHEPSLVDRFGNNKLDSYSKSHLNMLSLPDSGTDGYTKLQVIGSPDLNQDQLWRLFDIVPGMDYCHLRYEGRPQPMRSVSTVVFSNHQAASYACEKLHGFEYPIGNRLIVKPEQSGSRLYKEPNDGRSFSDSSTGSGLSLRGNLKPDILQLAETIAQATSIIQAAGISPDLLQSRISTGGESPRKSNNISCSVELPDVKPLANIGASAEIRCFIVCSPYALPSHILTDVFSRFGNLIDVYMLHNRNCGYAKYTSRLSAESAISLLHGAEVCGVRLKVMEAEERDHDTKRMRLDSES